MSLETDLVAVLQSQCPNVYPDVAPYDAPRPYVIYQQIGGPALVYVEGTLPDKRAAELEISVWADTRLAANALMLQIEAALCAAATLQAKPSGALRAAHDDDTDRRGAQQDFEIWAGR